MYDYNVQVEYHSCSHALVLYFILYFNSLLCFPELHATSVATPLSSGCQVTYHVSGVVYLHTTMPIPPSPPASFFLVLR